MERVVLGKCPNCGADVVVGRYGAYCVGKCGMRFAYAMGRKLSEEEIAILLSGERILLRNLKNKEGKIYNAYLTPAGTQKYSYEKDGETKSGIQWKFDFEFPEDDELLEEEVTDDFLPVIDEALPFR